MDNQFRPQGFSILPLVVKNLLIINVIFFLATWAAESVWRIDLSQYLGLHYIGASDFRPYQFVTYMFMHGSFAHLFFNMFALWMFGNSIENVWGPKRFLIFYFVCGIGAGLTQELVQHIQFSDLIQNYQYVRMGNRSIPVDEYLNMVTTVGASGAVYGILLAFGMMWPNSRIYIYFAIPVKAKWFVIIYGLIELFSGFSSVDNVAHFAHLGGMIFGLGLILYWRYKAGIWDPKFNIRFNKNNDFGGSRPKSDWDYNKERAEDQKKTDEILDKISKGGYDSLTDEEKEFLFRQSKKN
ncbi:MAG: rhomboid family intramembrane serine protease [Bacteroidales bacterium]|nr:rhomboid family intramembrane serine protease [Bacteroidales bacterium]